jgi:hypothetical protein
LFDENAETIMKVKRLLLTVLAGCLMALSPNGAHGQSGPREGQVRCSITFEDGRLSKGRPAHVLVRLENVSGKDLKLWAVYQFNLKNLSEEAVSRGHDVAGDEYYSPSGIMSEGGRLALAPQDLNNTVRVDRTTTRFRNEEIHLRSGEVKQFKVDLTRLVWGARMSSYTASQQFFDLIRRGTYGLSLELGGDKVKAVSNQVDVRVE